MYLLLETKLFQVLYCNNTEGKSPTKRIKVLYPSTKPAPKGWSLISAWSCFLWCIPAPYLKAPRITRIIPGIANWLRFDRYDPKILKWPARLGRQLQSKEWWRQSNLNLYLLDSRVDYQLKRCRCCTEGWQRMGQSTSTKLQDKSSQNHGEIFLEMQIYPLGLWVPMIKVRNFGNPNTRKCQILQWRGRKFSPDWAPRVGGKLNYPHQKNIPNRRNPVKNLFSHKLSL